MRRSRTLAADICVIGAGAGGAVAAAELAEGGMRVVLVEQGRGYDTRDFTARPPEMLARLYRDGGQTVTLGHPPIALPLGRGLGGTTLINSGTCFPTPPPVLERWQREYGLEGYDEASIRPYFERVERALSVTEVTPELAGENAAVARRGAERLGWSHGYLRRNAAGCVGSGVCVFGCPAGAKQHTGLTYVPRARAAGAIVLTETNVRRIIVERGRTQGIDATTPSGRLRVSAPVVIAAAGAIHTPALLARSRLGASSGQLGGNLSLHPATAVVACMDHVVDMARGVPQSLYIDEFAREGIMLEGIAGPPAYVAMSLPLVGERHTEVMRDYRRLAQFGLMVSDSSRGRVHIVGGHPVIRYDLNREDLHRFRAGLMRLEQLFTAAGAREILLPLPPGVRPETARRRDLKLMAFHPLGTARADARPTHGVIDAELELHDAAGVYVADGSAVPSALGVNPQLTIMALATRLADRLLSHAGARLAGAQTAGARTAGARTAGARTAGPRSSVAYTP